MVNQKTRILVAFGCLLVAAIIVLGIIRFSSGPEDTWICQEEGWVKHGNPGEPMPNEECYYD